MSVGNDFKNVILDSILGDNHSMLVPETVYLALFTSAVGDDLSGTEVAASDYERVELDNDSTNFPDAVGGIKTLAVEVSWPAAESEWGTIGWWAIFDDQAPSGNLLLWGRGGGLNPPVHVEGATFVIPAETLTIRTA